MEGNILDANGGDRDIAIKHDTDVANTAVNYINNTVSGSGNYLQYNGSTSSDFNAFTNWAVGWGAGSSGNTYVADIDYVDDERDLEKYLEVQLGMGTGTYSSELDAWNGFVAIMRGQDKGVDPITGWGNPASPDGWETKYEAIEINEYIRAGYEVNP